MNTGMNRLSDERRTSYPFYIGVDVSERAWTGEIWTHNERECHPDLALALAVRFGRQIPLLVRSGLQTGSGFVHETCS
jgi:hypothetical protein